MTFGAGLVATRHGQTSRWFHDVSPVGIMALHAVHFAFDDGMMVRQVKFRVGLKVTFETCRGIAPRIDNKPAAAAAAGDMFAARAVARFATVVWLSCESVQPQSRMRAGDETPGVVGVALKAGLIADIGRAFD